MRIRSLALAAAASRPTPAMEGRPRTSRAYYHYLAAGSRIATLATSVGVDPYNAELDLLGWRDDGRRRGGAFLARLDATSLRWRPPTSPLARPQRTLETRTRAIVRHRQMLYSTLGTITRSRPCRQPGVPQPRRLPIIFERSPRCSTRMRVMSKSASIPRRVATVLDVAMIRRNDHRVRAADPASRPLSRRRTASGLHAAAEWAHEAARGPHRRRRHHDRDSLRFRPRSQASAGRRSESPRSAGSGIYRCWSAVHHHRPYARAIHQIASGSRQDPRRIYAVAKKGASPALGMIADMRANPKFSSPLPTIAESHRLVHQDHRRQNAEPFPSCARCLLNSSDSAATAPCTPLRATAADRTPRRGLLSGQHDQPTAPVM